eukprot:scaffold158778_cov14-Prasinocladus_malaysianus.AAC.1
MNRWTDKRVYSKNALKRTGIQRDRQTVEPLACASAPRTWQTPVRPQKACWRSRCPLYSVKNKAQASVTRQRS